MVVKDDAGSGHEGRGNRERRITPLTSLGRFGVWGLTLVVR